MDNTAINHFVDMPSIRLIQRIRHSRKCRYWLNAYGELVGIWQGRNGKTYAAGHTVSGRTIIFRTSGPDDHWERSI
jgi:hypothetical protein